MLTLLKLYIYVVQLGGKDSEMENVSISQLRAHLLKYLKLVQKGEHINVTSKGKVLAMLTPPVSQQDAARAKLEALAKTAVIHDVVSPADAPWDAMK